MNADWDQLLCEYFAETCVEALSDYFRSQGFDAHGVTRVGGVMFRPHDCYVEISYIPRDLTRLRDLLHCRN